jgi:hypothetical protein
VNGTCVNLGCTLTSECPTELGFECHEVPEADEGVGFCIIPCEGDEDCDSAEKVGNSPGKTKCIPTETPNVGYCKEGA